MFLMSLIFSKKKPSGSFVTVTPVSSDDEAIDLINDSNYGLTASIWTADAQCARALGERLAGVTMINRCDYVDPKVP